jgi:ring-1,2-phenylacetyl-CoA epoxidase subunit PaaC
VTDESVPPGPAIFEAAADAEATAQAVAAAAQVAPERADLVLVNTLEPSTREPMRRLLLTLADNKYMLGRRYAEWCTGAPMLESAVAAAAMAQDELGHARSFYPLLRGFGTPSPMEDRGWQTQQTSAMACLDRPFTAWSDFIAANLVVDTALTTLLESARDSAYEPLRQRARKIVQEEATHWVHATGWLSRLGSDGEQAARRTLPDAMCWFGPADDPVVSPLVRAGILALDSEALRASLAERLRALLDAAPTALPWDRWDRDARRVRAA